MLARRVARPLRHAHQQPAAAARATRQQRAAAAACTGAARHAASAPCVVRPAVAADVPRLAAIEAACGALSAGWSAADIEAELGRGMARVLVAVAPSAVSTAEASSGSGAQQQQQQQQQPLGYIAAWLVAGELQVLELAVDPAQQGRGVGGALLAALLDACSAEAAAGAVLEVKAHNSRAIRLYERHGFAAVGRRPRFYACGADALLMARPASAARA